MELNVKINTIKQLSLFLESMGVREADKMIIELFDDYSEREGKDLEMAFSEFQLSEAAEYLKAHDLRTMQIQKTKNNFKSEFAVNAYQESDNQLRLFGMREARV
jgi:hypothetical protein